MDQNDLKKFATDEEKKFLESIDNKTISERDEYMQGVAAMAYEFIEELYEKYDLRDVNIIPEDIIYYMFKKYPR